MAQLTPGDIERLLAELRREAADTGGRLTGLRSAANTLRAEQVAKALEGKVHVREEAGQWRRDQLVGLAEAFERRRAATARSVSLNARELAPGPLGLPWDATEWPDPGSSVGHHVRVGTLRLPGAEGLPAVLPLFGASGWVVRAPQETFSGLAHSLIVRTLVAYGPHLVRVVAFDPSLVSDLGLYSEIRQVDRLAVPSPLNTIGAFELAVTELLSQLGGVEDLLASGGYRSVVEQADDVGQPRCPFRLLIVYGASGELSQSASQSLAQVLRVGGPRGVFTLISEEAARTLAPTAERLLPNLEVTSSGATHSAMPNVRIALDAPPARDAILATCRELVRRPSVDSAPTVSLAALVDDIPDPWMDEAETGLEVVYGKAGRANLVLRLRGQDPPMPNAIVGGAVGEGKSNLLLTLIYGLAAKYSPQDLEMVLVDLKDGVEFGRLAPDADGRNWLPHVRVLGLEFDRQFALAVLDWAEQTVHHRGALMRDSDASTIGEYRRRTGQAMPRVLVVIDEFHRLFEGSDEDVDRAARLLESLARTARSAGVHFVLASQTISGIRGLASKSDAVFAQFHNRISLKNTAAESQAILAPRNVAAASLTHRGEVIANEALGEDPEANVRGVVAHADKTYTRALQRRLWIEGSTGEPPRIFRASRWAPIPARRPAASAASLCVLAPGAPISISEDVRLVELISGPEQSVVALGTDRELVGRVLVSSLRSALASESKATMVTVLDGVSPDGGLDPVVGLVLSEIERSGVPCRHIRRPEVATAMRAMSDRGSHGGTSLELLLPLGLDGVVDLDNDDPDTYLPVADRLRKLMRTGSLDGLVVLGWWQSRHRAEEQLGFGIPGVRGFALCGVGLEDLQSICGHGVKQPGGYPRVVWFDRSARVGAEVLVPFELPPETREVSRG